jgi:hypothetical protein
MDLIPSSGALAVDRKTRRRLTPLAAQYAQDAALAALLGGNLFGRVAMHPALGGISDKAERGLVLNRAWRRYGNVESAALVALVAGWVSTRNDESGPLWTSPRRRRLILAKDIAVGTVAVTGLAAAAGGVRFSSQAPDGAVPMESGTDTATETPPKAARMKRAINVLGTLNVAAEFALLGVNVLLHRSIWRRLS